MLLRDGLNNLNYRRTHFFLQNPRKLINGSLMFTDTAGLISTVSRDELGRE